MRLSAFPKCYLRELCVDRTMTIFEWIGLAHDHLRPVGVQGLEMYWRFLESFEPAYLTQVKSSLDEAGFAMPMFCASPDFTTPDAAQRKREVELEKRCLEAAAALGAKTCRILSGQRRPEVSRRDGVVWTLESINELLPHAEQCGVILAMENHFKDSFWELPEFAQRSEVFLEIIGQIQSPWFGVNYDPSNTLLAGEDYLALLDSVARRVVSMHASDRRPRPGAGQILDYSQMIHGEIGTGLIDFDAIFATLRAAGFTGWVSIEDGESGIEELRRSAEFLAAKSHLLP